MFMHKNTNDKPVGENYICSQMICNNLFAITSLVLGLNQRFLLYDIVKKEIQNANFTQNIYNTLTKYKDF